MGSLLTIPHQQNQQPLLPVAVARPRLPCKTRLKLFFLATFVDLSFRADGTVNRCLYTFLEFLCYKSPPDPKPRHGVSTCDVTVDPSRNLWFRIFVPCSHSEASPAARLPVVVFFHGGGFVCLAADFKLYDEFCRRFAREANAVIVSVNYRLEPEHRYPAQFEDGFDVLKFLDDREDALPEKADVSRCFLAGDSAGGNLAHHVAKGACEANLNHVQVIGIVSILPFFGGEERTKSEIEVAQVEVLVTLKRTSWMWKAFIPSEMNRDHEVINVSGPNAADISKLKYFPATMVVMGGFDSLKDWQVKYYEYLKKSGKESYLVEFPDMIHSFHLFPELPQLYTFFREATQFINTQCSKPQTKA